MRTLTTTLALLLAALTGWLGCGSTIVGGTGGSASAGGVGGSAASTTGPTSTSSAHASSASSASSGGTGGGQGGTGGGQGTCSAGEKLCDGNCVTVGDPMYGCAQTGCAPCATYPNASPACVAGACALGACDTGFKNCNQVDANGCEADILTDPENCGACGSACVIPHATATCSDGMCLVPEGCGGSGWVDCGMDTSDCVNLLYDPMNCGACGNVCPSQQECDEGVCALVCPKGTANCAGDPQGVCATMLGTNKNCNFCGDTCGLANAISQCEPNNAPPPGPDYVCTLQVCNTGWANCDMIASNGCEQNTSTDASNCGSCENVCPSGPHGTPVCNGGACDMVCDPGFMDCNNVASDGCEVDVDTDPNNCGACGHQCATPACSGGTCM